MELVILSFLMGAVYAYGGMFLTALVGDMRGSRLHAFIDQSIPRGLLVMVAWPIALAIAAGYAHRKAHHSKQVLL